MEKKKKPVVDINIMPKLGDIPISTRTIIVVANFNIDLTLVYKYLPVCQFTLLKKKRGRKKKGPIIKYNQGIPNGAIISISEGKKTKGVIMKKKPESPHTRDYFKNSVSVVMMIENDKRINFKITKWGKFQMTGCKTMQNAIDAIYNTYKYIKRIELETNTRILLVKENVMNESIPFTGTPTLIFNNVMKNIDFKLGFKLNREKIDRFFKENREYKICPFYDPSNNPGIMLKRKRDIAYDLLLDKMIIKDDHNHFDNYNTDLSDQKLYTMTTVPFKEYINMLSLKDQQDLLKKQKKAYHSFTLFHSGSVTLTTAGEEMEEIYDLFVKILKENIDIFMERLRIN